MSDKLTKLLIVIFLTLLIWTWAFLALEKRESFRGTLVISQQSDPALLVSFSADGIDYGRQVPLKLTFIGTPDKISELTKRSKLTPQGEAQRERLDYAYNPTEEGHIESTTYTFNLLSFLQNHSKTKDLALTLDACEIAGRLVTNIEVKIEVLQKKDCKIRCLNNEDGSLVSDAEITPAIIAMYVRQNDLAEATVKLTREQLDRARKQPVHVTPFVQLGNAEERFADKTVAVRLPSLSDSVSKPFQTTLPIGIIINEKLQNAYRVEIVKESEAKARSAVQVLATDEARKAYEAVPYPLLIEVRDGDQLRDDIPLKTIIYNFPAEYVQKGQIKLENPEEAKNRQVKIKLIPNTAPTQ